MTASYDAAGLGAQTVQTAGHFGSLGQKAFQFNSQRFLAAFKPVDLDVQLSGPLMKSGFFGLGLLAFPVKTRDVRQVTVQILGVNRTALLVGLPFVRRGKRFGLHLHNGQPHVLALFMLGRDPSGLGFDIVLALPDRSVPTWADSVTIRSNSPV